MSDSRPPNPADDAEDSPKPENTTASAPDSGSTDHVNTPIKLERRKAKEDETALEEKGAEDESKPETSPDETDEESTESGEDDTESAENDTESGETPDIDLEGVRAASMISMSGGPKSSRAKWAFINLFIKLFKLTARFFPALLMLGGLSYSYIHFFGAPPIMDKVMSTPTMEKITSNPTVEAMLDKVGIEVLTPEEREEAAVKKPKSKVDQMLQQTRDVVAASNARVNLGNALAEGAFDDIEDMVAEAEEDGEGGEGTGEEGDSAESDGTPDPLSAGAQAARLPDAVSVSTYSGSNAAWAELRKEADGAARVAELIGEQITEPEAPPGK